MPTISVVSTREITIQLKAVRLSCTITSPEINDRLPRPAVLMIHGWRGNSTRYTEQARALAEHGFICLAVNLRGHGASEGNWETSSMKDHLTDAIAAFDHLGTIPNVDRRNIGVMAASYGCSIAMLLCDERKINWLALRAPALYPNAGFAEPTVDAIENLSGYRREHITPSRNRALRSLSAFKGNVLVVAGEKDADIPLSSIKSVVDACKNARNVDLQMITDADHNLSQPLWRALANSIIQHWIIKQA